MKAIINSGFEGDDKFYIGLTRYGAQCFENKIEVRSHWTRQPLN